LAGVSLRQLKAQYGRCPLCDAPLLLADHEPQSPEEWEQWLMVIRKAVRRDAITTERDTGTLDEPDAFHLVHADCRRRSRTAVDTAASAIL
jgi:RNA-directed DNA polymerase